MKYAYLLAAAAGLATVAAPASAETYRFVITGDYSADFTLDSNPTPDDYVNGTGFALWDVNGFPDAVLGVADLSFYNAAIGGGMQIYDFYGASTLLVTDGAQLYSGPESTPGFLTGTFALTEYQGTGQYSLTISPLSTGPTVPEPATWAMMVGGFGLAGTALRRRGYKKGKTGLAFTA